MTDDPASGEQREHSFAAGRTSLIESEPFAATEHSLVVEQFAVGEKSVVLVELLEEAYQGY